MQSLKSLTTQGKTETIKCLRKYFIIFISTLLRQKVGSFVGNNVLGSLKKYL